MKLTQKSQPHIMILVRRRNFPPYKGAAASRHSSLARYWGKITDVSVVTPLAEPLNADYNRYPFQLTEVRFDFVKLIFRFSKLVRLAKQLKPDVIFASFPISWQLFEGYLLSRKLKCPFIVDVRDLPAGMYPARKGSLARRIFNALMRSMSFFAMRNASVIVTVTDYLRRSLKNNENLSEKKIFAVPNGSETSLFKPSATSKKEFDLLYSGTLIPARNPDLLIKFLFLLSRLYPRLNVLFLSDILETALGSQFIYSLRQYDLIKYVEFERMTSINKLPAYLAKAKLGIDSLSPAVYSHKGAVSAKDYEYLAAGLPVVGLLDPDFYVETKNLILDNGVGILDPDPESLARKTASLLKDPQHLRKMSKHAREVGWCFDRKKLAEDYYYKVILPIWRKRFVNTY